MNSELSTTNTWPGQARRIANGARKRVLDLTIDRNGCYLSQTLSSADLLATLYTKSLDLGPSGGSPIPPEFSGVPGDDGAGYGLGAAYNGPRGPGFDRLLISPAHYAVAIYAVLVETGRMAPEALDQFNTDGSTVEMIGAEHSPGFELTTGSFGQALSQAGGIAMARKLRGEAGRVFVFMSDGELEEGQTWEAVQCLNHYDLDNVIVCVDVNGMQYDGATEEVMTIEPIPSRVEGFGGVAVTVDGHDVEAIDSAIQDTVHEGKPLFVLCYTDSARHVPMLNERKPKLHFVRFRNDRELADARATAESWGPAE
ncbi:MAG: thiamine pyrophosphate-dependent enzyme [Rhodospirillales bacterium]|nr:thiamine pyrophosphate-dependent enzyme [Rhodospirillales bacterium]